VLARISLTAEEIAVCRNVTLRSELMNADPPASCDPTAFAALETACRTHGARHQFMISRACHDSLFMSLIAALQ
jgi:hypothetical protein